MASNLVIATPRPISTRDLTSITVSVERLYNVLYFTRWSEMQTAVRRPARGSIPDRHRLVVSYVYISTFSWQLSGVPEVAGKAYGVLEKIVGLLKKVIFHRETSQKLLAEADKTRADADKARAEATRALAEADKIRSEAMKAKAEALHAVIQDLQAVGYSPEEVRRLVSQADGAISTLMKATEQGKLTGVGMN